MRAPCYCATSTISGNSNSDNDQPQSTLPRLVLILLTKSKDLYTLAFSTQEELSQWKETLVNECGVIENKSRIDTYVVSQVRKRLDLRTRSMNIIIIIRIYQKNTFSPCVNLYRANRQRKALRVMTITIIMRTIQIIAIVPVPIIVILRIIIAIAGRTAPPAATTAIATKRAPKFALQPEKSFSIEKLHRQRIHKPQPLFQQLLFCPLNYPSTCLPPC